MPTIGDLTNTVLSSLEEVTNIPVDEEAPDCAPCVGGVPFITGLSPTSVAPGSGAFTLTVTGGNFLADSEVIFNGATRATTYISSTELQAAILAGDVDESGVFSVVVNNP